MSSISESKDENILTEIVRGKIMKNLVRLLTVNQTFGYERIEHFDYGAKEWRGNSSNPTTLSRKNPS